MFRRTCKGKGRVSSQALEGAYRWGLYFKGMNEIIQKLKKK